MKISFFESLWPFSILNLPFSHSSSLPWHPQITPTALLNSFSLFVWSILPRSNYIIPHPIVSRLRLTPFRTKASALLFAFFLGNIVEDVINFTVWHGRFSAVNERSAFFQSLRFGDFLGSEYLLRAGLAGYRSKLEGEECGLGPCSSRHGMCFLCTLMHCWWWVESCSVALFDL